MSREPTAFRLNIPDAALEDLRGRELAVLVPIIVLCFAMGLYPTPFLSRMQPSIDRILAHVDGGRVPRLAHR